MEYTVKKLSLLAGVSLRTIRYYDEINLLKPAKISPSGYRIYGPQEINTLQQILFYRELGVSLDSIKNILSAPSFDELQALQEHRQQLVHQREQLNLLIANVEKTIKLKKGMIEMTDKEKFEGFKHQLIADNEQKYGAELIEKFGKEAIERSNKAFKDMSKDDYQKMTGLAELTNSTLAEAFAHGDPAGELAQKAADLHRQWLTMCWGHYNKEAHAGLAQMYVDDERFTAYYDQERPGTAKFLRDAILIYTKN